MSKTPMTDECAFSLGRPPRWDVQRLVIVSRQLETELAAMKTLLAAVAGEGVKRGLLMAKLREENAALREDADKWRSYSGKQFPVLRGYGKTPANIPASVPYAWIESCGSQCQINHGQSVARLAERGGLSPHEIWHVAHGKKWDEKSTKPPTHDEVNAWLRSSPWLDAAMRKEST